MFAQKLKRTIGFTLAEVLITLGIIGVVAALTMPVLIVNHQKKATVTKLKKFYSIMSQAILLAEVNNGEYPNWAPTQAMSSEQFIEWYNQYLDSHITSISKTRLDNVYSKIGFSDGSGFVAYANNSGLIPIMYCTELKYCDVETYDGIHSFLFFLTPEKKESFGHFYAGCIDATREEMLRVCKYGYDGSPNKSRHCCAGLIQYDGWEIKKDYPWK